MKSFYIDIKSIELVEKKERCFKEKWNISRVSNPKTKNCAPKFPLKKRKKSLPIKTLSYLGSLQSRAYHITLPRSESFIYSFLGFVQTCWTANFLETSF